MRKAGLLLKPFLIVLLTTSVCLNATSVAEVPHLISYQGRVLDDNGETVNNSYDIVFRIYAAAVGGSPLWTETHPSIKILDGLFTVSLGTYTAFGTLFDGSQFWLSVQLVGEGESSERIPLVMVPYAYRSEIADSAVNLGGEFVETTGDTMSGDLHFESGGGGSTEATVDLRSGYANLELRSDDTLTAKIWGQDYGGAYLYHGGNGNTRIEMDALYQGGLILLRDINEATQIRLDAGGDGNGSVSLPDNAIDDDEILNEPGIARDKDTWFIEIPDTLPTTCIYSTLRAPASGYIVAFGRGYMWMTGEQHGGVEVALTTVADGWPGNSHEIRMGVGREPNRGYDLVRRDAFSIERVWAVDSAEAITCYLRSRRTDLNADYVAIHNPSVLMMYFPTSYGTVSSWVSAEEAAGFDRARAFDIGDPQDPSSPTETVYQVDLRELELKALRKRIEAEAAERRLLEAQKRDQERRQ
ncbi:MAG: hypothetical protein ABIE70_00595 [bacterium]